MPLAPEVIEIHDAELVAVHGHVLDVVTETVPVVPDAGTDVAVGVIV